MRVAVTGGAGFIGRATVKALEAIGHEARVIDRSQGGIDVRSSTTSTLFRGCDAAIHLAGVLGTSELFDRADEAIDVNVTGTLRVLEACRYYDLAYVGITVPDCWPSVYQATKLAATRLASSFHHAYGVPVTHIRAFNVYGEGQPHGDRHPQKIIPTFAAKSWAGEPMPIWGDGTQTVDLVHVDHVAGLLAQCAAHPEAAFVGDDQTWDAGTGQAISVRQVAGLIAGITGCYDIDHLPMRAGETPETFMRATDPGPFPFDRFGMDRLREVVESYRHAKVAA